MSIEITGAHGALTDQPLRPKVSGRSGPRTRLGCLTCRRRKVRCDQSDIQTPVRLRCGNCTRLELECYYAPPGAPRKRPQRPDKAAVPADPTRVPMYGSSAGGSTDGQQALMQRTEAQGFVSSPWTPQSAIESTRSITHRPTPLLPQTDVAPDQAQVDRIFGDMTDPSNLPAEQDWQTTFPSGVWSPMNGLFLSALLPWKDVPPNGNILVDANETQLNDGSWTDVRPNAGPCDLYRGLSARVSSASVAASRHEECNSLLERPGKVDLAMFDVTEHQRYLLRHFTPQVNPIPLIAPLDSQWRSAYSSLLGMACGCSYLINAICTISELHLAVKHQGSVEQALTYYQSASARAEEILSLSDSQIDDRTLKQAFATLFLLMHAEIMAQPLAGTDKWSKTHLRTAYKHLMHHNERLKPWTGIGSHILSWIQIIDSKAVYAAGMENETDRPSPDSNPAGVASPSGTLAEVVSVAQPSPAPSHPVHLSSADVGPPTDTKGVTEERPSTEDTLSAAEIAYDALNRPAYRFFLRCQSFIPRIIALDQHHRPRGPLDAELEVLRIGQIIRAELRELWAKRPIDLNVLSDSLGLQDVLHPRVARKIIRSFRIYIANFYAVRILLHRVAFMNYPAGDEVKQSISEIMKLAGDQLTDENGRSGGTTRDSSETQNAPGPITAQLSAEGPSEESQWTAEEDTPPAGGHPLGAPWLWPLFMCGTECGHDERRWVLEQVHAMKGSVNAQRTATLLAEVTKRQDETSQRVDQRSVRQQIFEDEFDLVY